MKKLLIPSLAMLLWAAPNAHAGYFAFHADVIEHIGDVLGDFGRPPSDEEPTCEEDATQAGCEQAPDDLTPVVLGPSSWYIWLASAFGL